MTTNKCVENDMDSRWEVNTNMDSNKNKNKIEICNEEQVRKEWQQNKCEEKL
jgi:hypothetical protein